MTTSKPPRKRAHPLRAMKDAVASLDSTQKKMVGSRPEPTSVESLAVWRTRMNLTSVKTSAAIRRSQKRG